MNYLFFDIETVFGKTINKRIVSFGYVKTDENFKILTEEDIFINPQEKEALDNNFEWKEEATKDKEGFKNFYHKIKALLEDKNVIVVGHGALSDAYYLANECDRFHFEPLDFNYMDTHILAKKLLDKDVSKKLQDLHDYLCEQGNYVAHRSLDDAKMTMEVFIALLRLAEKQSVNVYDEEYFSNSLRKIYGENEQIARRSGEWFTCHFDMPIFGLLVNYRYLSGGERKKNKIIVHYDYARNRFFYPIHPKKGSRIEQSVLTKKSVESVQNKAVGSMYGFLDYCKNFPYRKNFFCEKGEKLLHFNLKPIFYNVTSCEINARYQGDELEFDFQVLTTKADLKNANGCPRNEVKNLAWGLKNIHTHETAERSMQLMAKMKFGYKDKNFPNVQPVDCEFQSDTDKYRLPKTYFDLLQASETVKTENGCLINGDKEYIPTVKEFRNNFFEEPLRLPVLIERQI